MKISLIADTITTAATHVLGFSKFQSLTSADQSSTAGALQISAASLPIDAVAPPPVKPYYLKSAPSLLRKRNRTRRRSLTGDDEDGENGGFFGGDGPFGGGGGGGGGWGNFDGYGGAESSDWGESSKSWADPAFDFVYEVVSWIALSNCLHYALKKVMRIAADDGEKARFTPIC